MQLYRITNSSVNYGQTVTQRDRNQNCKFVMSVEHIYLDSIMTDALPTTSLGRYTVFEEHLLMR